MQIALSHLALQHLPAWLSSSTVDGGEKRLGLVTSSSILSQRVVHGVNLTLE
jgi:hypothetical protein